MTTRLATTTPGVTIEAKTTPAVTIGVLPLGPALVIGMLTIPTPMTLIATTCELTEQGPAGRDPVHAQHVSSPAVIADMIAGEWTRETAEASRLEWEFADLLRIPLAIATNPNLRLRAGATAWFIPSGVFDPRVGMILPEHVTALLADPDVLIRLSPDRVTVSRQAAASYRPGRALARAVRLRDVTCRFPGCSVPAARCHLDHVVAYPEGATEQDNLHALCRTHHGFKHHAGWAVTMTPDGVCSWRAPTGRVHITRPPDPFDQAA